MAARILVADDNRLMRRVLRALLEAESGWEVCGEAADGQEAVAKAKQLCPDLVVLDLTMPDMSGLEAGRQILKARPGALALVLSTVDCGKVLPDIWKVGIHGCVLKSRANRDLVAAAQALLQGKTFFPSRVAA